MKIAILGFGKQSKSVYEYLKDRGDKITILDRSTITELPEGVQSSFGENYLNNLEDYDLIFRTSGIHPKDIITANSEGILNKVTSNTNRFFEDCPTTNVIGVTGTKGKGTTSTLIAELLKGLGLSVHLGGNIGTPPLDLLKDGVNKNDWVVLELASFQLIDIKYSPHIALCLIVEPEHLDWHSDVTEYYESKKQLFKWQKPEDMAIYYAPNSTSKEIASSGAGKLIPYFSEPGAVVSGDFITIDGKEVVKTSELKLLGKHNWQNVCAALTTVWQINQDLEKISQVIRDFEPLPFRLEPRRKVNGVTFYNDSFSSAPTSAIAAIEAVSGMKILILGGKDRGIDLSHLCQTIQRESSTIRKALLLGASAKRLSECLSQAGFNNYEIVEDQSMEGIIKRAMELSSSGDSVVLSPGFPSFDMFKDFEDRGNQFNQAVEKL